MTLTEIYTIFTKVLSVGILWFYILLYIEVYKKECKINFDF